MKKFFTLSALAASFLCAGSSFAGSLWNQVPQASAPNQKLMAFQPKSYLVLTLNEPWLKAQMFSLSTDPAEGMVIELPMPDGSYKNFKVWQDPMLEEPLGRQYSDIKTFTGTMVGDPHVTAKLDFTIYGFHAMIFDGANTSFVDPYDNYHDGYYFAHYKKDETRTAEQRMHCEFKGHNDNEANGEVAQLANADNLPKLAQRTGNGWTRKDYRLALTADHFYCQAATGVASPTFAQCLSKMTTTMNRVNGVYEREFSVHMNIIANDTVIIWRKHPDALNGSDPFNSIDNNGGACLTQNQTTVTSRIGSANYDVGHVLTTGGGGISGLGIVCQNSQKAQSCTGSPTPVGDGYDIDYVAHEMGHEFGSEHTFANNNDGSCGGNAVSTYAYEPGSGTTIMAYAGICPPDDLAMHSEAYFHASSLVQITQALVGSENACAVRTATGNKLVYLPTFSTSYSIPYKTPFELTAPAAVDSVADTATQYCWEQWNRGSASSSTSSRFVNTFVKGPIFRSWFPVYTQTRVFPRMNKVLAGTLTDAGVEGAQGEKVPDTARFLTFKLTVRNFLNGYGCFLFPDDTIHLDAIQTPTRAGFKVTSQGTTGISYTGGSTQTVTWDVAGTTAAPIGATNVVIYMSKDGGNTWPYTLGTFPNNGSATVTLPNPGGSPTACRFKVKGSGNVFFNVNLKNFTVTTNGISAVSAVNNFAEAINVFPVPASDVLNISSSANGTVDAIIYNAVGQAVWRGTVNGKSELSVATWARGVYHMQVMSTEGERAVKSFVLQ